MNFVLALVVVFASSLACAKTFHSTVLNLSLPFRDIESLISLSTARNSNELLERIHQLFPDIYFARVAPGRTPPLDDPELISWRDTRVSVREELSFQKLIAQVEKSDELYSFGGIYLPAFSAPFEGEKRPLHDKPVMVLNVFSVKEVIWHELLHYLIDRERVRRLGLLREPYACRINSQLRDAQQAYHRIRSTPDDVSDLEVLLDVARFRMEKFITEEIEDVEIVVFLLENQNVFGLSARELKSQLSYAYHKFLQGVPKMNENMMLFHDVLTSSKGAAPLALLKVSEYWGGFEARLKAMGELHRRLSHQNDLLMSLEQNSLSCQGIWGF